VVKTLSVVMNPLELLVIAFVLSLDSFATSVAIGISMCGLNNKQTLRLAASFSVAHVLMIFAGYLVGLTIVRFVDAFDHWIAFFLLVGIGIKFIYEGFKSGGKTNDCTYDPTRGKLLLGLAVVTSIDALVLGGTFPTLNVNLPLALLVIGIGVFIMTVLGTKTWKIAGKNVARYSDFLGGMVLILLGFKILLEHAVIF